MPVKQRTLHYIECLSDQWFVLWNSSWICRQLLLDFKNLNNTVDKHQPLELGESHLIAVNEVRNNDVRLINRCIPESFKSRWSFSWNNQKSEPKPLMKQDTTGRKGNIQPRSVTPNEGVFILFLLWRFFFVLFVHLQSAAVLGANRLWAALAAVIISSTVQYILIVNRCTDSLTDGGGCILSYACPGVHMMPCCAIFTVVSLALRLSHGLNSKAAADVDRKWEGGPSCQNLLLTKQG